MKKKDCELNTESLQRTLNAIERLQEANDLLVELFAELGPYRDGKISDRLWRKVNNYIGFDDSE